MEKVNLIIDNVEPPTKFQLTLFGGSDLKTRIKPIGNHHDMTGYYEKKKYTIKNMLREIQVNPEDVGINLEEMSKKMSVARFKEGVIEKLEYAKSLAGILNLPPSEVYSKLKNNRLVKKLDKIPSRVFNIMKESNVHLTLDDLLYVTDYPLIRELKVDSNVIKHINSMKEIMEENKYKHIKWGTYLYNILKHKTELQDLSNDYFYTLKEVAEKDKIASIDKLENEIFTLTRKAYKKYGEVGAKKTLEIFRNHNYDYDTCKKTIDYAIRNSIRIGKISYLIMNGHHHKLLQKVMSKIKKYKTTYDLNDLISVVLAPKDLIKRKGPLTILRSLEKIGCPKLNLPLLEEAIRAFDNIMTKDLYSNIDRYNDIIEELISLKGKVREENRINLVNELEDKVKYKEKMITSKIGSLIRKINKLNNKAISLSRDPHDLYEFLHYENNLTVNKALRLIDSSLDRTIRYKQNPLTILDFSKTSEEESRKFSERAIKMLKYLEKRNLELGFFSETDGRNYKYKIKGISKHEHKDWNDPRSYIDTATKIVTLLPRFHTEYKDILSMINKYGDPNNGLFYELKNREIAQGVKIAEIGGKIIKPIFEALGAEVDDTDAYLGVLGKVLDREDIVNTRNYKEKFPRLYDIVVTNFVFDVGSGLTNALGYNDYDYVSRKLLSICSNITKKYGYNLHAHMGWRGGLPDEDFISSIGFEKAYERDLGLTITAILRKIS